MSKYIDANKLIAEIEWMREINKKAFKAEHIRADEFRGRTQAINHLFDFITYLQQEQPVDIPSAGSGAVSTTPPKFKLEVKEQPVEGLEEEVKKYWNAHALDYRIGRVADLDFLFLCARHFAEWGARHSINWKDVQLLDTFILELSREEKDGADWGDSEKFYTEVLRRFHEFNDKKIPEIVAEWGVEHTKQKPELVQHPAISYMYNADAGRGEQMKQAVLALLKSDLIQVAGRGFTKTELIEWVETRPVEMKEDEK